jgi:heme exporter protein C
MTTTRYLHILNFVTVGVLIAATWMVFVYAPREATMGEVQRIFYFHVPSAWVAALAFLTTVFAGAAYLKTNNHKWDHIGLASVEIGLTFALMNVASGAVWGCVAWNSCWNWDARLTTASIACLAYVAYLMLRAGIADPERRARFAAVYGMVSFISVPLTYFSIILVRSIHPVVFGPNNPDATAGDSPLTPRMLHTFFFCLFTFTVLYTDLLWNRVRLERLAERVERVKARFLEAR